MATNFAKTTFAKTSFAKTGGAVISSLLAVSMLAGAVPAQAQYRGDYRNDYRRDRDGISAGEVIAGAVVIGGLAAILSANNGRGRYGYDRYDNRDYDNRNYDNRGYDNRGYDRDRSGYDWQRYGGSRSAIEQCISAVERRGGRGGDIDVTRITDVDRLRDGYRVEGRVAVDYRGGGYRGNDYGDRYDDRYGQRYDDRGSFSCNVRFGRIDGLSVRGI